MIFKVRRRCQVLDEEKRKRKRKRKRNRRDCGKIREWTIP
jgi:hypothetical protein